MCINIWRFVRVIGWVQIVWGRVTSRPAFQNAAISRASNYVSQYRYKRQGRSTAGPRGRLRRHCLHNSLVNSAHRPFCHWLVRFEYEDQIGIIVMKGVIKKYSDSKKDVTEPDKLFILFGSGSCSRFFNSALSSSSYLNKFRFIFI